MSLKVALLVSATLWLGMEVHGQDAAKVSPSIAQVVKLHESNVGTEVLLAYVKETPVAKPNADEVLYLKQKGIPDEVIVALLSKRVWADQVAPQSQAPAAQTQGNGQPHLPPAVAPAQPATQTVTVQAPPTVQYVAPPPVHYPYYYPYYYDPWPRFSVGIGFGHYWGGGHWHGGHCWGGGHHGGGLHARHR